MASETTGFTQRERTWITRALFGMATTFACGLVAGAAFISLLDVGCKFQ